MKKKKNNIRCKHKWTQPNTRISKRDFGYGFEDSHEEIIKKYKLNDNKLENRDIVREEEDYTICEKCAEVKILASRYFRYMEYRE